MARVVLGNNTPKHSGSDGEPLGPSETHIPHLSEDAVESVKMITALDGIWANHSHDDSPTYIVTDDALLGELLRRHYGLDASAVKDFGEGPGPETPPDPEISIFRDAADGGQATPAPIEATHIDIEDPQ